MKLWVITENTTFRKLLYLANCTG